MTSCQNCDNSKKEYTGNGSQTDYTFQFEYFVQSDVGVDNWDPATFQWVPVTGWQFLNDTTIRFDVAPTEGQKFKIYRCTNLDTLPAEFYPGTAIKAQDLNNNFFVLKSAIEDAGCALSSGGSGGGGGGGTVIAITGTSPIKVTGTDTVKNIAVDSAGINFKGVVNLTDSPTYNDSRSAVNAIAVTPAGLVSNWLPKNWSNLPQLTY